MEAFLSASYQPFTITGLIMVGLVLIEIVSLVAGFSLSQFLDHGLDLEAFSGHHAETDLGFLGGILGWVNAGRVPLLVFIITWLAAFAAVGFAVQTLAMSVLAPLPVPVASLIAFCFAAPATRHTTRLVAHIVPRDETYTVTNDDLIGRIAEVTLGPLDQGAPGRIKVRDAHDNLHFLMAKAADGKGPIPVGAEVLLVDRQGPTFLVIPAPAELKNTN
jgi:membrane protein implicated in regulation of membrane protease activity